MDEQYLLTTPENVPIAYELAGIGSRFVAAIVDSLISGAIMIGLYFVAVVIGIVFAATADPREGPEAEGLAWLVIALVFLIGFAAFLGYYFFFEIIWNGQTPGKRAASIRVVRDDGGPVTATAVVIRNVVRLVDSLPAYYIIGIITMLIDKKGRRLGDLAAGTIVVKERRDVAVDRLSYGASLQPPRAPRASFAPIANLERLSYDDYRLVNEYLLRRDQLAPGPAQDLAWRVAGLIAAKLDLELGAERPEDFLDRIGAALGEQAQR